MNIRSLFLHLDTSPSCASRVELAIALALEHGAHLQAVAASGWPRSAEWGVDLLGFAPLLPPSNDQIMAAKHACEAFSDRAQARGLGSFTARLEEAASTQALVEMARCHDMAIVGQTERSGGDPTVPADLPVRLLMQSGRPLLVVPWAGRFDTPPRTVLLAWKNARESARAAADALPLLARAQAVHGVVFERPGHPEAQAAPALDAVQRWLALHGVSAQPHREATEIDFGDALLSRAADLGADLIVMGGYGHARTTEFVLGGMTRTVLASMTVPVLMAN